MARPKILADPVKVTLTLDRSDLEGLDELREPGESRSAAVRWLIRDWVQKTLDQEADPT